MKKLFILLLVLGISTHIIAEIKSNQIIGKWKYTVIIDQGNLTGIFKFEENEGKLTGEIHTNEGRTIPFTKIKVKEENTLYLELHTDSDTIKVTLKVEGDKFNGTASSNQGEAPITGDKIK